MTRGTLRLATALATATLLALPLALSSTAAASVPVLTQVAAGFRHTCVLTTGGGVKCWGANGDGQLGDGSLTSRSLPVNVSGLASGVSAISAGFFHTCALTTGGGVKCWGDNGSGQLGITLAASRVSAPVDVSGLASGIIGIAAGGNHTCALTNGGAVRCWGANADGQLGNGVTTGSSAPVDVSGLASGIKAITAGLRHTCALTTSGGAMCWGANDDGQLGNGKRTRSTTPVAVSGLATGLQAIAAGGYHSCALTTAGGVKCWGDNSYAQLGNGAFADKTTPVGVTGLASGVATIAAGRSHTCALLTSGAAKCWGSNSEGQLGDGSTTLRSKPVAVSSQASFKKIGAGGFHTCVVTTDGAVKCWGYDTDGQLGDGAKIAGGVPVAVSGLSAGVKRIASGADHSCALTTAGGVKCWGANGGGQLGNGTRTASNVPVNVSGLTTGVKAIATGGFHTCALTSGGGIKCWGSNGDGQLGDGVSTNSSVAVNVAGLASGISAISAGIFHTCALTGGGAVKCWGDNGRGQLGSGSSASRSATPVDVAGLSSGVVAIAAGGYHTCALMSGGAVTCWGANGDGQLGNGSTTDTRSPVPVGGLTSGITAVAGGLRHTCALTSAGAVTCWGANGDGQLGNGTKTRGTTPAGVTGLGNGVMAISAGGYHSCALTTGGAVRCWGDNSRAQLGNGSFSDSSTPVPVSGLTSGQSAIAAGRSHSCALATGGGVVCWGYNSDGQLGNASTAIKRVPVNVVFVIAQTISVVPSRAAGTIPSSTVVTFAASVLPLAPAGSHGTARFVVYHLVKGTWVLAAQRDVSATAGGKATLRWTFSVAGSWYVRARAQAYGSHSASAWSPLVRYTVR